MVERNEEFRRLQAYHENTRITIRYLDSPMARCVRAIRLAIKGMPAQKDILQLGLAELEERIRRVRVRKMDLASLPKGRVPAVPEEGRYGIEILTPTAGAAQTGIPQGDLRRWHARIVAPDAVQIPTTQVRWSSDKEGTLKGIEETRFDGRATHAFIQFRFKIPGAQVVTVEAIAPGGQRYKAELPVKVIPVLPESTRFTGEVPEEELLFRAASAEFLQPSDIEWQKGLPMHRNITFVVQLQPSDGKPFRARNIRFVSDKDGNLGVPLVEFKDGVTFAHVMFLFTTPGERTISVEAIDESGKKAFDTRVLTILPRTIAGVPEGFTGELAEGEVPFTVSKFIMQRLRPAIDSLHGIYDNAIRHANRDMRFLVKWKRFVEKDFADVQDVGADVQHDAGGGKIGKLNKHVKRLIHGLHVFERRIALFNRAMREQRMVNQFLAQTRDSIVAVGNATRNIPVEPLPEDVDVELVHSLQASFAQAYRGLSQNYAAIRSRVAEMGRRVQRIDSGIKHYKEDLDSMIDALRGSRPHAEMAADLASRLNDMKSTVQKELLEDINGMIELLRGLIDDIAASQRQLNRLETLSKKLKA